MRQTLLILGMATTLATGCEDEVSHLDASAPPRDAAADASVQNDGATTDGGFVDAGAAEDATTDGGVCGPVPSCNWCGGNALIDNQGCVVGYECANGVDPCQTQPCSLMPPTGCAPNEICGPDMLCWPSDSDAGVADAGAPHDGGTVQAPTCSYIGTRSEGWYRADGSRVCWASCASNVAECRYNGTFSEGWYGSQGTGCNAAGVPELIEYADCAP